MKKRPGITAGQGGISLIESLVAILIIAVGVLGLAMLQAQGFKFNNGSYNRTQATYLAYDIMDKIRANEANADAYAGIAASTCDITGITAANDIKCWQDDTGDTLGSDAVSTITTIAASTYRISINWKDRAVRDTDNNPSTSQAAIDRNLVLSMEL